MDVLLDRGNSKIINPAERGFRHSTFLPPRPNLSMNGLDSKPEDAVSFFMSVIHQPI